MKRIQTKLQTGLMVLVGLYLLYVIKSALGINISQRYHAIDLVKIPAKYLLYKLNALS